MPSLLSLTHNSVVFSAAPPFTQLVPVEQDQLLIKIKIKERKKERMNDMILWTYCLCFLIIKLEQLQTAVSLQRSVKVPHVVVHFSDHRVISKALAV